MNDAWTDLLDQPDAPQLLAGLSFADALARAVLSDRNLAFHAKICAEVLGNHRMIWVEAIQTGRPPNVCWDVNRPDEEDFAISHEDILHLGLTPPSRARASVSAKGERKRDEYCRVDLPKRVQRRYHQFLDLLRDGKLVATGFEIATNKTIQIDAAVWQSSRFLIDLADAALRPSMIESPTFEQIKLDLPSPIVCESSQLAGAALSKIKSHRGGSEKHPWDDLANQMAISFWRYGFPDNHADAMRRALFFVEKLGWREVPKRDLITEAMLKRLGPCWQLIPKGANAKLDDVTVRRLATPIELPGEL